jgi:putative DNA-invertase from lambdoid prophage Rac
MSTFAYLRVSTDNKGQTTDNQRKTIEDAKFQVDEWHSEDGVSGKINALDRPVFKALMSKVVSGDEVVTVTLDRLGRNAIDILNTVERFKNKGIKLRCLAIGDVDLTSMAGQILVHMLALVADLERQMLSTRTKAGMARTKAEGTLLGRHMKVSYDVLVDCVEERKKGTQLSVLAAKHSIDKNTLLQTIRKWEDKLEEYQARWAQQLKQAKEKAEASI